VSDWRNVIFVDGGTASLSTTQARAVIRGQKTHKNELQFKFRGNFYSDALNDRAGILGLHAKIAKKLGIEIRYGAHVFSSINGGDTVLRVRIKMNGNMFDCKTGHSATAQA